MQAAIDRENPADYVFEAGEIVENWILEEPIGRCVDSRSCMHEQDATGEGGRGALAPFLQFAGIGGGG